MAASTSRSGAYGGAVPFRSMEGLSTRPAASSDEIQLRIDPMHADFDEEITGLRNQVKLLRHVANDIQSEAKFQNDFLEQLQMAVSKAQAGVKNNIRMLNKSIIKNGSNHIVHVVLFGLFCFMILYLWSKVWRR